jgi:nitroreductase
MPENTEEYWNHFKAINKDRRAYKDFDGRQIPDQDIEAILNEALLAPSSGNVQPYQIHWIKTPELKEQVAKACNGQRAATSASTLLVFVSSIQIAKKSLKDHSVYVEQSTLLTEKSKVFHRKTFKTLNNFLKFGPLVIWTPLVGFFSWFVPSISILPFGTLGVRHWTAKNTIFSAQNLLLAAVAKGYDACPMEGFNAPKIASLLNLPYGSVLPVIIALGKKSNLAHVDPQWRRPIGDAVIIY